MKRAVALAALVASIAGCSLSGRAADAADASAIDGGIWAAEDSGPQSDAAGPPAPDAAQLDDAGAGLWGEYDSRSDPAGAVQACFNGDDDDSNGDGDCDDRSCRANVPACCVGASDASCCVEGATVALEIASCDGAVDGCAALVAMAEPFGAPLPEVGEHGSELEGATLVPRGAASDSGLVLRDSIDPRVHAVRIEARIAGDHDGHGEGGDVVAVGLVDAASAGTLSHVAPIVALMISGNRGEISLLLAGEIVQRWPLESGFHDYALTVRPSGAVALARDGRTLGSSTLSIARPVRPIVYGRTFNPAPLSTPPVRVQSLSVRRDACDVPSALSDGAVVFPPAGDASWDGVRRVASPSIARWVDGAGEIQARMALEIDGAIHLASFDGDAWALNGAIGTPALAGGATWAERVGDPALRWNGTALELWFTGYRGSTGTIARVLAAEGTEAFAWADVEPLFVPAIGESYAQPAPFRAGSEHVVVRLQDASGDALVLYREDATGWARVGALRSASGALSAFDRDEVASPSVVEGSVYRLYFAGRRGLRWSIGTLISPDGLTWIEPHGGALVRSSSGAGFDALGATDPAVVIDGDTARLFYTGLDGERARIGVATGTAPPR